MIATPTGKSCQNRHFSGSLASVCLSHNLVMKDGLRLCPHLSPLTFHPLPPLRQALIRQNRSACKRYRETSSGEGTGHHR